MRGENIVIILFISILLLIGSLAFMTNSRIETDCQDLKGVVMTDVGGSYVCVDSKVVLKKY